MRHELAVRIGAAAADFGKALIRNAQIAQMRQVIEHSRGGGILLAFGQLLGLFECVAEQFRHVRMITGFSPPAATSISPTRFRVGFTAIRLPRPSGVMPGLDLGIHDEVPYKNSY
jgi:hypothetical protein